MIASNQYSIQKAKSQRTVNMMARTHLQVLISTKQV